ncbi:MAG: hypothetical protein [Arizlama microvirus]|nr:MAG: hypothetical protein [Arizlama microvirus]
MKIRTWANYARPRGESSTAPSKTVPDMSISIREQYDRHRSGGKVKQFQPVSDEQLGLRLASDFGFGDPERMDKVEIAVASKRLADFVATERGKLITARQHQENEARKAFIIEEYRKGLGPQSLLEQRPPINEGPST